MIDFVTFKLMMKITLKVSSSLHSLMNQYLKHAGRRTFCHLWMNEVRLFLQ